MKLIRKIEITPAWDLRNVDQTKNYGVHNAEIWFSVTGARGAVTVSMDTGWQLPTIAPFNGSCYPDAIAFSWHSKEKRTFDTWEKDCPFTGGECWSIVSFTKAKDFNSALTELGSDGVFKLLEKEYRKFFKEKS